MIEGDTNTSDAYDPAAEWTGLGNDVTSGLGSHNPLPTPAGPASAQLDDEDGFLIAPQVTTTTVVVEEEAPAPVKAPALQNVQQIADIDIHGNAILPSEDDFLA